MQTEQGRLERLWEQLRALGPLLPGSISTQWNACGTPGCRCKAPRHPKKHGPYHQLSFTVGGRSSTLFLKPVDLPEARRRIQRYQRFKTLTKELLHAYVCLARTQGLAGRAR